MSQRRRLEMKLERLKCPWIRCPKLSSRLVHQHDFEILIGSLFCNINAFHGYLDILCLATVGLIFLWIKDDFSVAHGELYLSKENLML